MNHVTMVAIGTISTYQQQQQQKKYLREICEKCVKDHHKLYKPFNGVVIGQKKCRLMQRSEREREFSQFIVL